MGVGGGTATGLVMGTFQLGAIRTHHPIMALWPAANALGGAVLSAGIDCCNTIGEAPPHIARMIASPLIYSLLTAPIIVRAWTRPRVEFPQH
jgi:hypothetical protein